MKKLNIIFCSFPDYAGNAKVLYEYMKKRYSNSQNLYWAVQSIEVAQDLCKKGIEAKVIGSEEFYECIKTVDLFFTTHANLTEDKFKTKKGIYVELWHGIGPKPVGFLANNMLEEDKEWYSEISEIIDYFIVSSEFWRIVFAAQFNFNADRIKVLGLPILDEITSSNGKNNLKKILNLDTSKYKKIIMYLPTFRKGCGRELSVNYSNDTIFNIKNYSDDKLLDFLKENNYLLIVKRHPSEERTYKTINNDYIKNIDNFLLTQHLLNINNILNAADIIITDYSSIGTEYSFLDKPTIYISTDLKEYKQERGLILDDYEFWTEGCECNTFEKLKMLINSCDNKVVSKNKKLFYGDLIDGGCNRICNFFFDDNGSLRKEITRNKNYFETTIGLKKKIKIEQEEKAKIENKNSELQQKLNELYNSKGWKFLEKIRRIKRIIMGKR